MTNLTFQRLEEEIINNNFSYLQQSKVNFENRIESIKKIMISIYFDASVKKLQNMTDINNNIYSIYLLKNNLRDYAYDGFILDYYIYFQKNHSVFHNNALYRDTIFYKYCLNYDDLSFKEWEKLGISNHAFQILPLMRTQYNGNKIDTITCFLPLGSSSARSGSIGFMIDQASIIKIMGWDDIEDGSVAFITDQNGALITKSGSVSEDSAISISEISKGPVQQDGWRRDVIDGKRLVVFYVVSKETGLSYHMIHSESSLLNPYFETRGMFNAILIAMVFISILGTILFSKQSLSPMKKLASAFPVSLESVDDSMDLYEHIRYALNRLYSENKTLGIQIEGLSSHFQEAFLLKIMSNSTLTGQEYQRHLELLDIDFAKGYCICCIVKTLVYRSELQQEDVVENIYKRVVMVDIFADQNNLKQFQINIADNKVFLLCFVSETDMRLVEDTINGYFKNAFDMIQRYYHIETLVGIGRLCSEAAMLSKSFVDADEIVKYQVYIPTSNNIIRYTEKKVNSKIVFSTEILTNVVLSGEKEQINAVFDQLYADNLKNNQLNPSLKKMFVYNLLATLKQVNDRLEDEEQVPIEPIYTTIESPVYSAILVFETIRETYLTICGVIHNKKKRMDEMILGEIYTYLDQQFLNPDLSLVMVSEHFNLSISSICQILKTNNLTFLTYIEQKRMDYAKGLLRKNLEKSIANVALECGYNSTTSFCRAFKRVNGITPTEFRSGL